MNEKKTSPVSAAMQIVDEANVTPSSKRRWWQWFLVYPAFFGALLGAIPTGMDLYKSFKYNIGYTDVARAEEQRRLWIKNFECTRNISYQKVQTDENVLVQVGACSNGDILVEVIPPEKNRIVEWISLDRIKKASAAMSLISSTALAGTLAPGAIRLAARDVKVMCQAWANSGANQTLINRIVKDEGKCYRETIDILSGKVKARKEVSCNSTCS